MEANFSLVQLLLSAMIFLVMFFGISFLVNMLLRKTWAVTFAYPIIIIMMIDDLDTMDYFTKSSETFSTLVNKLTSLQVADITILTSGLIGTIIAAYVMKYLRKNGYQMF